LLFDFEFFEFLKDLLEFLRQNRPN
jgi:hypothetical protein